MILGNSLLTIDSLNSRILMTTVEINNLTTKDSTFENLTLNGI